MCLSHVGMEMEGWGVWGCWWHSIGVTTAHPLHPMWIQADVCHTGHGIPQPCAS